jgi:CBS domain containing-hemolysin-like protein
MTIGIEVVVILLLIVLNGLFALSELALVSVRRARLAVLERKGVKGATAARALSDDPQRFLPTVQVGITLVSRPGWKPSRKSPASPKASPWRWWSSSRPTSRLCSASWCQSNSPCAPRS